MTFTSEKNEFILPEYSNTGRIEIGCSMFDETGQPITGMMSCLKKNKAYLADENGLIIQEFWLQTYTSIHGEIVTIRQSDPTKPRPGDILIENASYNHPSDFYIRQKDELMFIHSNENGAIEQVSFSNDNSYQYALAFILLILIIFLSMSGLIKFRQ